MKHSIFTGSGTALITPMYPFDSPQKGAINFDVFNSLLSIKSLILPMHLLSLVQREKLLH